MKSGKPMIVLVVVVVVAVALGGASCRPSSERAADCNQANQAAAAGFAEARSRLEAHPKYPTAITMAEVRDAIGRDPDSCCFPPGEFSVEPCAQGPCRLGWWVWWGCGSKVWRINVLAKESTAGDVRGFSKVYRFVLEEGVAAGERVR